MKITKQEIKNRASLFLLTMGSIFLIPAAQKFIENNFIQIPLWLIGIVIIFLTLFFFEVK
jgi:hypothetical protein